MISLMDYEALNCANVFVKTPEDNNKAKQNTATETLKIEAEISNSEEFKIEAECSDLLDAQR